MAVVRAAALVVPMLVVRLLRQAAGQRTAAAVAERAGQGAIAEGDDAALEHADWAVISPALAEGEADTDPEVLQEPVQLLAGRRIAADRFDVVHERHCLLDLGLDARRRLTMWHPLFGISQGLLRRRQLGL